MAPVDTNEPQRDEHLRSPDFFDAAAYPEIRFEATQIEAITGGRFVVAGDLALYGVRRELALDVTYHGTDVDPRGNTASGSTRPGSSAGRTFGMRFNQALGSGNRLVGDAVRLSLEISAVKHP